MGKPVKVEYLGLRGTQFMSRSASEPRARKTCLLFDDKNRQWREVFCQAVRLDWLQQSPQPSGERPRQLGELGVGHVLSVFGGPGENRPDLSGAFR